MKDNSKGAEKSLRFYHGGHGHLQIFSLAVNFFPLVGPLYVTAKKQVYVCLSSRWQLSNGLEFEHGTLCTLRPLAGGKRYTVGGLPYRYKWSDMGPL